MYELKIYGLQTLPTSAAKPVRWVLHQGLIEAADDGEAIKVAESICADVTHAILLKDGQILWRKGASAAKEA